MKLFKKEKKNCSDARMVEAEEMIRKEIVPLFECCIPVYECTKNVIETAIDEVFKVHCGLKEDMSEKSVVSFCEYAKPKLDLIKNCLEKRNLSIERGFSVFTALQKANLIAKMDISDEALTEIFFAQKKVIPFTKEQMMDYLSVTKEKSKMQKFVNDDGLMIDKKGDLIERNYIAEINDLLSNLNVSS